MENTPIKMAAPMYDVYIGAETGLLKGFNVQKQIWDNLNSLETADRSNEICSLCWNDRYSEVLCLGLKNNTVKLYDTNSGNLLEPCVLSDCQGKLRSLISVEDSFIAATDCGKVYSWKDENTNELVDTKGNLHCMVQNPHRKNIISTGGKENDLKLWDLTNISAPIFQAKNVKNDWLNLRVPIWIMGTCFLHNNNVVTCTGHHQVRVYDYKSSQRRPVLDMQFDEYPISAMSLVQNHDNQVVVGNTQGKMGLLDIRQGKLVHLFKGFAGGIRSVQCHASKPVVASCGLDRFLRVHDIESKALIHKVYLKSRLNCVALTKNWGEDIDELTKHQAAVGEDTEGVDGDSDKDDVWDNMEVVKTRTVKKSDNAVEELDSTTKTDGEKYVRKKRKSSLSDSGPENSYIPTNSKKLKSKKKRKKKNGQQSSR